MFFVMSIFVGTVDSNYAKLEAIRRVLKEIVVTDGYPLPITIVESDSTTVLAWIKAEGNHPWKYEKEIDDIRRITMHSNAISFANIYRERNTIVDSLAKRRASEQPEFIAWF